MVHNICNLDIIQDIRMVREIIRETVWKHAIRLQFYVNAEARKLEESRNSSKDLNVVKSFTPL